MAVSGASVDATIRQPPPQATGTYGAVLSSEMIQSVRDPLVRLELALHAAL